VQSFSQLILQQHLSRNSININSQQLSGALSENKRRP
jgi:hypothetical protein